MRFLVRLFIFFCFLSAVNTAAGQKPGIYTIQFTDKNGSPYSIAHPEAFLSLRALQRRNKQNIPVRETDLPLSPNYTDSLRSLGLKILCNSRWFNTVTILSDDTILIDTLSRLDFVRSVRLVKPAFSGKSGFSKWSHITVTETADFSPVQLKMLHGNDLHNHGYKGKGIVIAVLDAGFYHVDQLSAFDSLWDDHRILGMHDFVEGNTSVFEDHVHGMYVLSILAGNIPGKLNGSAPAASYWLFRTEDVSSEYPVEEDYWTAAAEFADSAGADIISSSLGYSIFDDPSLSYTYHDMNGRTTRVARSAVMAARRGMIVVTSAGNEGNRAWHYIISPADADSTLAAGAVDSLGHYAFFSSRGPTADGRIKPDVSAMGVSVLLQGANGQLLRGNGTSFSTPLISGLTACLWQAFPDAGAREIITAVRTSADHYMHPDNYTGYGIPDYLSAYTRLKIARQLSDTYPVAVFPNPFHEQLNLIFKNAGYPVLQIRIFDLTGRLEFSKTLYDLHEGTQFIPLNLKKYLSAGLHILQITGMNKPLNIRIVKY